jgi:hypothetical protein
MRVFKPAKLDQFERLATRVFAFAPADARRSSGHRRRCPPPTCAGTPHRTLEHHVDRALVRRIRGHVLTVDQNLAFGRQFEPGNHAQQGRLAAARWAEQHEEFARHDIKADIVDRGHLAKALGDIADLDDGVLSVIQWVSAMPLTPCTLSATAVRAMVRRIRMVEAALTSGVTEKRTIE